MNNHYIPKCYLEKWAGEDGKVHFYRTLVSNENVDLWDSKPPSGIGYQKHLYTHISSGKEHNDIERWFDKEFENPVAPVLDKVVSEKKLTPQDWSVLIDFLAAQDVRSPVRYEEHLASGPAISAAFEERKAKSLSEISHAQKRGDLSSYVSQTIDPTVDGNSDHTKYIPLLVETKADENLGEGVVSTNLCIGRSSWLYTIKSMLTPCQRNVLHDHNHKWRIIKPARGYTWFTSDNPVVKLNCYGPREYDLDGRWNNENGIIIFPLDPDHAMFVKIGKRLKRQGSRLSKEETMQIRECIARNAYRLVFSGNEDFDIPRIRPRTTNKKLYDKERKARQTFASDNAKAERKYFKSNND